MKKENIFFAEEKKNRERKGGEIFEEGIFLQENEMEENISEEKYISCRGEEKPSRKRRKLFWEGKYVFWEE